jgi:hypothetical protein
MAKAKIKNFVTIGDQKYDREKLTSAAKEAIRSINFCDAKIRQLQNELAVSETARLGYKYAIHHEVKLTK